VSRESAPSRGDRRRSAPIVAAALLGAIGLVALLLAAGAFAVSHCGGNGEASLGAPAPRLVTAPTSPSLPAPARSPARRRSSPAPRAPRPARLEIPAIGVRAPVVPLGLNKDRTLEVPKDFGDTGWWTGGARPGEGGPAVVAGHVDSHTGPAVFFRIGALHRGDAITIVRRDGSRVRFTVQRSARYRKNDFPTALVYGPTPRPTLRLITCSGTFDSGSGHYLDNTIVFATRA
jgi:hypothetical protein